MAFLHSHNILFLESTHRESTPNTAAIDDDKRKFVFAPSDEFQIQMHGTFFGQNSIIW